MQIATRVSRMAREAGTYLVRFTHAGVLVVGLLALFVGAASYLESGRLPFPMQFALSPGHSSAHRGAAGGEAAAALAEADEHELSREMSRVMGFVSRRYRISQVALEPLLAEAEQTGRQLGLDPMLLVAVMAIESSFNPFAESVMGAQGLMQVIPRFHMDKIGENAGENALFDPQINIRVGALVLKEGLSRFGSMQSALQYYGGALGDPNAGYAAKVLAMKARLRQAAGRSDAA